MDRNRRDHIRRLRSVDAPTGFFTNEFYLDNVFETDLPVKSTLPMGAYVESEYDSLGQLTLKQLRPGIIGRSAYRYDAGEMWGIPGSYV